MSLEELHLMEQNGALRILVQISEKDRYITELRKSGVNPEGVVSLSSLNICRQDLGDLGLIEEIVEEGARPRTYLVITDKGRRVAQKIREIQEILEEGS